MVSRVTLEEAERYIAEARAREQDLRDWAAENWATPLGRVTAKLLTEDDAGDELSGHSPDYYSGLAFALGAVMDEVLPPSA